MTIKATKTEAFDYLLLSYVQLRDKYLANGGHDAEQQESLDAMLKEMRAMVSSLPLDPALPKNIERAIGMARHEVEIGNGEEEEQAIVYLADRLANSPPPQTSCQ